VAGNLDHITRGLARRFRLLSRGAVATADRLIAERNPAGRLGIVICDDRRFAASNAW
jgi:hypothetical protein